MSHDPQYANDSLRWVAAEVRYPSLDDLTTEVQAQVRQALHDDFPVQEQQPQVSLSVGIGAPASPARQVILHRFLRRDRLMSVTLSSEAVTLETTEYHGWTAFRDLFLKVLRSLEAARKPDGVLRAGLRYIDEVRLPQPPESVTGWKGWISDHLLEPFSLDPSASPSNGTVILQYGDAPGYVTVFRAAPFAKGRTVQEQGPLRMPFTTPDGPYFLLDTDASWADPNRQIPEFSISSLETILETLHKPCRQLFEASITGELRDQVLSKRREGTQ